MISGADLIADERNRQLGDEEHWTSNHDDQHTNGELAVAAAYLAMPIGEEYEWGGGEPQWAVDLAIKHASDRVRELTIAGALIAAEIDRLQRSKARIA